MEPSHLLSSATNTIRIPDRGAFVIAAGKAAWPMAQAFTRLYPANIHRGLVAGPRTGSGSVDPRFAWFDAGHPAPNAASVAAAAEALALAVATSGDADARLVVLLSGGASAMLAAPATGVTLEDKIETARRLMLAGMAIGDLNCVRKHLSDVKGGQLAAAAGRTLTLAISDVHGPIADDPSVIGSGPTVPDPTTFAEALRIVGGVDEVPPRVRARLESGAAGHLPETPKPGDRRVLDSVYEIIGNRLTAVAGARRMAESLGYRVIAIEGAIEGEARDASRHFVEQSLQIAAVASSPVCVLGAGETTVTVRGAGKGGRNQEFALAAAPLVAAFARDAVLASAGTDGADGPTDAAGARVDRTTLARAAEAGLDWLSTLENNDAYHFFEPLGDLIRWGPTGTNVGDVQIFLTA